MAARGGRLSGSSSRDGSVYLGPRYVEITQLRHGIAESLGEGKVRVSYPGSEEIEDPDVRRKAKLSFHASGILNTPAGRLYRSSLRSITKQELLCFAVFQHPTKFPTLDTAAVKDRDVCLRYPIDERRPLWCHLYVAPKENVEFVTPASAVFQGRWPGQHRGGRRAVAGCVGGLAGCSLLNTATAFVPVSFGTARPPLSGQALHVANADRHGQCPNRQPTSHRVHRLNEWARAVSSDNSGMEGLWATRVARKTRKSTSNSS